MAMEIIVPLSGGASAAEMWTADRRLCLTADKARVVPEASPEARWLWCTPGTQVPMADAVRLGAVVPEPVAAPEPETDGEPEPETDGAEPSAPAKRAAAKRG